MVSRVLSKYRRFPAALAVRVGLFLNGWMQAPNALEYGFHERCLGGIREALIAMPFSQRHQMLSGYVDGQHICVIGQVAAVVHV